MSRSVVSIDTPTAHDAARRRSGPEHVEEARRLMGVAVAQLEEVHRLTLSPGSPAVVVSATTDYARALIELAQVHATLAAAAPAYESIDMPWWVDSHPFPDPPMPEQS